MFLLGILASVYVYTPHGMHVHTCNGGNIHIAVGTLRKGYTWFQQQYQWRDVQRIICWQGRQWRI